jgi:alkyl hydroperoxide reductase subunit AhpF
MPLITDEVAPHVRNALSGLETPVTLKFHPQPGSPASEAMEQLLDELTAFSDKLVVEKESALPAPMPPEEAEDLESSITEFWVDGKPTGIRYLGFPGGHEFGPFLEAMVAVSKHSAPKISEATRQWIEALDKPLHLEVFVTPT